MSNEELTALQSAWISVKKSKCASFFEFVREFWSVVIPEAPVWNWHIPYLCQELEAIGYRLKNREPKDHDLLINIPPGTTKSTIVTIMFPAWLWSIDPTIRIISNSYSSDISTEHAVKSRDIISSPKYQLIFPEVQIRKDKSGKQTYDNTANGARYTTSTGGAITGKHAHLIINDDPQNPKQADSEAHRKQSVEHTKTLASRKVDKDVAVTITVMQRLNTQDVSGYLLDKKNDGLKHIKLPAEATDKTQPIPADDTVFLQEASGAVRSPTLQQLYAQHQGLLDANRLSRSAINEAKVDLGTRGYNGQFLQNPTAEEGDIVKSDWFRIVTREYFNNIQRQRAVIHFFLDTAYTSKTDNDPTGIIAATEIAGTLYILNRIKVRKEFPDLLRFIPEWVRNNGYDEYSTIRIEPKANGLSVIQTLQATTGLNVTRTPTPKDDKRTRLNVVAPKIECGRVALVQGAWNAEFIEEVSGFPNAPHDEDVDLLCYAADYLLKPLEFTAQISGDILF